MERDGGRITMEASNAEVQIQDREREDWAGLRGGDGNQTFLLLSHLPFLQSTFKFNFWSNQYSYNMIFPNQRERISWKLYSCGVCHSVFPSWCSGSDSKGYLINNGHAINCCLRAVVEKRACHLGDTVTNSQQISFIYSGVISDRFLLIWFCLNNKQLYFGIIKLHHTEISLSIERCSLGFQYAI